MKYRSQMIKLRKRNMKGANNPFYGKHHTEETKLKISQNKERGRKISEKCKGKPKSIEHRLNLSKGRKGIKLSEEHKNNIKKNCARYWKGKVLSQETRKKISLSRKGKKYPKLSETRKKLFLEGKLKPYNLGKKLSKEYRDKISLNHADVNGEKNPRWLGGKSFEPYGQGFTKKFRKFIRSRDNQICILCGIHKEKIRRALNVHHINYDKNLNIPQNCVSLCNSCHAKTGINREHRTKFFQSLLSEKYGYQYLEGEVIIR